MVDANKVIDVCWLCQDCQMACRQAANVTVVSCPRYVRVPRQQQIAAVADATRRRRGREVYK